MYWASAALSLKLPAADCEPTVEEDDDVLSPVDRIADTDPFGESSFLEFVGGGEESTNFREIMPLEIVFVFKEF
jgi:hypothetical protein